MPATSQDEFLKKVLECVDGQPRTVLEIAKRAGVSWQAAKKVLERMRMAGAIKSKKIGERTMYYRIERPDDTWFRIPIKDEHRKVLEYIYVRASKKYAEITGKPLGRTQAQKIAVKVIRRAGLDIPTPRYLYGRVTLLTFEKTPRDAKLDPSLAKTLDPQIDKAVEWAVGREGKQIAEAQYREEDNKLHRTLMVIEQKLKEIISRKGAGKKVSGEEITDLLMDLLAYVPDEEDVVEVVKELLSHRWLLERGFADALKFMALYGAARQVIAKQLMYEDLREAGFTDEELENLISAKHFSILEFKYLLSDVDETVASEKTRDALDKIRKGADDEETREWKEIGSEILRKLGFD